MLVVETIVRIRREHFVKGKTINEVVRDLKVSRNTVRKVLRRDQGRRRSSTSASVNPSPGSIPGDHSSTQCWRRTRRRRRGSG